MVIGIKGYGIYVPPFRIKVEEIMQTWVNTNPVYLHDIVNLKERAVCDYDEDVITMAVEASKNALKMSKLKVTEIGSIFFGSSTPPYIMKPASSIVLEALGAPNSSFIGDVQFSGKSGTLALQICFALVGQNLVKNALALGADNLSIHTEPGNSFEYPASAGAGAVILGTEDIIAEIEAFETFNSDTPDIYRLEGDRYLTRGGDAMVETDVGLPSHTKNAVKRLLDKLGREPKDFDYAVFHQTYGITPFVIGKSLGFEDSQITPSFIADELGDTGSSSVLIGLAKVLDEARPGQTILVASYGSGAGSDAFSLKVTDRINTVNRSPRVKELINAKTYINYATYAKLDRKYHRVGGE